MNAAYASLPSVVATSAPTVRIVALGFCWRSTAGGSASKTNVAQVRPRSWLTATAALLVAGSAPVTQTPAPVGASATAAKSTGGCSASGANRPEAGSTAYTGQSSTASAVPPTTRQSTARVPDGTDATGVSETVTSRQVRPPSMLTRRPLSRSGVSCFCVSKASRRLRILLSSRTSRPRTVRSARPRTPSGRARAAQVRPPSPDASSSSGQSKQSLTIA
jgi:hypothetical protein